MIATNLPVIPVDPQPSHCMMTWMAAADRLGAVGVMMPVTMTRASRRSAGGRSLKSRSQSSSLRRPGPGIRPISVTVLWLTVTIMMTVTVLAWQCGTGKLRVAMPSG